MQVSVETQEGLKRLLTVSKAEDEFNIELEKQIREVARNARIDGFRPGKAPLELIKKRFTKQIKADLQQKFFQPTILKAIQEQNLNVAGILNVEWVDEAPCMYKALVEIYPEISLKELNQDEIEQVDVELTAQDVDELIENLRGQRRNV